MFKNKNLAKIITHKYTLYFMYFLALLNGVNYLKKQKVYCALIAIAFFLLSNKFLTKNKALSIFYSLFLANFVLGCGKIIEGIDCGNCYDPNGPEDCKEKRDACMKKEQDAEYDTKVKIKVPIKYKIENPLNDDLDQQFNIKKHQSSKKPSAVNHNVVRTTGVGAVEAQEAARGQARGQAQQARGQAQQAPGQQQQQQQQRQQKQGGPGVSPVAHRQQQPTHTHNKQVVLITASVVASALALIVASGAIFLVNKKKF